MGVGVGRPTNQNKTIIFTAYENQCFPLTPPEPFHIFPTLIKELCQMFVLPLPATHFELITFCQPPPPAACLSFTFGCPYFLKYSAKKNLPNFGNSLFLSLLFSVASVHY